MSVRVCEGGWVNMITYKDVSLLHAKSFCAWRLFEMMMHEMPVRKMPVYDKPIGKCQFVKCKFMKCLFMRCELLT
jgi:hypothetical protein